MATIKSVSLSYQQGNSDKVYHIYLVEVTPNKYVVNAEWGRRGNALQSDTKTPSPVGLTIAENIFDKLEREKRRKGYQPSATQRGSSGVTGNVGYQGTQGKKPQTNIYLPQLLNVIDEDEVQIYINDNDYLTQEKKDGERRMVVSDGNVDITGRNKKGKEVELPVDIKDSINIPCVLDGEIIGDKLFVFDILSLNGKDLRNMPCIDRIATLFSLSFGDGVEIVETAFTKQEKERMLDRIKRQNGEGIVFKKKDAPYTVGRPASYGNQLKFKLNKTATFIVKNITQDKRSVGLELIDGNKRVFMGKVTIPPNYKMPEVDDLIEVRYLYAYKGGAVYQPVYLGKRPDSDLSDATLKQIVYKADQ